MTPDPAENKRVHLLIEGRVQGVFFRAYARDRAAQLHLTGWIRNTDDGKVEIVAEGTCPMLDSFVDWCKSGPPSAKVAGVTVEEQTYLGEFNVFSVRY